MDTASIRELREKNILAREMTIAELQNKKMESAEDLKRGQLIDAAQERDE